MREVCGPYGCGGDDEARQADSESGDGGAMSDKQQLFVVGRLLDDVAETQRWEFCGVFTLREHAEAHCSTDSHFVGPVPLDRYIGDDTTPWPDAYYPTFRDLVTE